MKVLKLFTLVLVCFCLFSAEEKPVETYKCLPCGLACDKAVSDKPGECPDCHMKMVPAASITFKTLEASEICAYLKYHPKTILLDVRTSEEFDGKADPNFGTLKNAINIPIHELENRLGEIERYKNREIIVYCSHSHRSPQASYLLTQKGFLHVINMAGGMSVFAGDSCRK
jgi:rhodanese-related sulfurtransferase/DNA-directed RNA polymerase subunit RPC12/RpoP